MSAVNHVGVEVNTASAALLAYVSGIGPTLADNIVKTRDERGGFTSRKGLLEVPRLGAKAFEQAAGFLRIRDAKNPLDGSSVHPEAYPVAEKIADLTAIQKALKGLVTRCSKGSRGCGCPIIDALAQDER